MDDKLILKANHFKNTQFGSQSDRVIAKAAQERFEAVSVNSSTTYMYVNHKTFYRIEYGYPEFNEDKVIAMSKNYSEDIIREVILTEI